jgi:signal transduction histidine kinase
VSILCGKLKTLLWDVPVLIKVMGIALGMTIFLGVGLFWTVNRPYQDLEVLEVDAHADFVAQALASAVSPLLRSGNEAEVQRLLDSMTQVVPGMGSAISTLQIIDGQNRIIAQSLGPMSLNPKPRSLRRVVDLPNDIRGQVVVELSDRHVNVEMDWHNHRLLAFTTIIGLLGLGVTGWLMYWILRPIRELVQVVRSVKNGNYGARSVIRARDEVGELAVAFNEMLTALQQKDVINHQLLRKLMLAEEDERKRVARELHDRTGEALIALMVCLTTLQSESNSKELNQVLTLAAGTLSEVHRLSRTLRPSALDQMGLAPALQKLCESTAKAMGLKVDFEAVGIEGSNRLPLDVELILYRVGQEGLNNAVLHGRAHSIEMLLHRKETGVQAIIEDDGQGFDATDWRGLCLDGDHAGLLSIEERITLLGGTLRVESKPGAGTSLVVEIPLPAHVNS